MGGSIGQWIESFPWVRVLELVVDVYLKAAVVCALAGLVTLLLRRSSDAGRTWSAPQVVWDDGANTCGNPCAVVDRVTGTVWLLSTWNP